MGGRQVRIPVPDGFANVTSKFTTVAARMRATEDPGVELLGVAVPDTFIPKLEISQMIDLEFYAKLSVNKNLRSMDITPGMYATLVSSVEKTLGESMNPGSSLLERVEKNSEKGLTEVLGEKPDLNFAGMKYLGFTEKSERVFTGMMLANVELNTRKLKILGTLSIIHVRQRVITVAVYRMAPTENSVKELTDFTKKWTAKIVAANK